MTPLKKRRALLYVPGDDAHKIEKAISLGVDAIILDIEDGVAANQKQAARQTILKALNEMDFGKSEKLVRVNPVASGMTLEDLEAILPGKPDGIVLPKVDGLADVKMVSEAIAKSEVRMKIKPGTIRMIGICESPWAMLRLEEICTGDERLDAIIFGGEDLAADLGATRTREGKEIFLGRSLVLLNAVAAGLQAIDMVCTDYRDEARLRAEALEGAQMGFTGKQVIHPNQVVPVQETFTPTAEEMTWATRVVEEFEENEKLRKGAFGLDGKMIDLPVVRRARNTLARGSA